MSALQSEDTDRRRIATLAGGSLALVTVVAFAYAGHLLHDSLPVGVVAGVLSGGGAYAFFRYVLRRNGEDRRPADDNLASGFHAGAAGYAFSSSGALILAGLYFVENPLVVVGGAVALAALEYTVVSQVLPR